MTPLLFFHVVAGLVGLLAGTLALIVRKGGAVHRTAGTVFVSAMLTMAVTAGLLSVTLPDWSNLPGAMFTVYLVATGWRTLRPPSALDRPFFLAALVLALTSAGVCAVFADRAMHAPEGLFSGKPAPNYLVFLALALFAAAMDVKVRLRAPLIGGERIERHVWRLCTALFFATGSFFLGQQKVMPGWMQGSPVLILAALAPLPMMAFWLAWVRRSRRFSPAAA